MWAQLTGPLPHDCRSPRAQRLETLDEVEEWQMLMGHYCYVTATRGALLDSLLAGVEGFEERRRAHGVVG